MPFAILTPPMVPIPAYKLVIVANPIVVTPALTSPINWRAVTTPVTLILFAPRILSVAIPATERSLKLFGAFSNAASNVALVTSSIEAIFSSALPELITLVAPT